MRLNGAAPAPLPEWLLERLTSTPPVPLLGASGVKTRARVNSGAQTGDLIIEGERNARLFRIACSMRGKGAHLEEIESELLEINARRSSPPLEAEEVQKIAGSAMRYAPNAVAVGA